MKILWTTNIPSPYRVDFFNELGKHCELTVVFERKGSSERDKDWEKYNFATFNGIILEGFNIGADKALGTDIINYIKKESYNHIIISNPLTPTGIIGIEYMRAKKIPYSIVSDGGFPKDGKGIKEMFKRHILKGAKIYFSTAAIHDKYYLMYGAKKENIVRYPFTSLKKGDILERPLRSFEKEKFRKKLGMKEENIIISVGQFIHRKGFDVLLNACSQLDNKTGIYIIGGTPSQEYLDQREKHNLENVHFEHFKTKHELSEYFKAADLFVLPTREDIWGLVINEAMAFGLPVITTNKCVAGLELVENEVNGYIIPTDDQMVLANKINYILDNKEIRIKMMDMSLSKIKSYTVENMARITLEILKD